MDAKTSGKIFQVNIESDHSEPMRYKNVLLYQLGEVRYEQGFDDEHEQWCYELSVILSGAGTFSINGNTITVKKGDIVLSPKTGRHAVAALDNQFRFLYLGFDLANDTQFEYMTVFQMYLMGLRDNVCRTDTRGIGTILSSMINEFKENLPYSFEYLLNCLETIIILSYRTFGNYSHGEDLVDAKTTSVGTTVYTLIKYIEDHVFSIPDIKTLATQMHFSYNHISHLFKKRTGTTLKHYIIQVKMKKAQQLITEGAWPISEIAVMLGYESIQSFSKAFKKEVGMSPSAFKKMRITPVEPESVIASQSHPE